MMPSSTNKKIKRIVAYSLSIAVIFLFWFVAAKIINSDLILPAPGKVLNQIIKNLATVPFWRSFLFTLLRVLGTDTLTLFLGTIIGILCAESDFIDDFLRIPLTIIRATPVVALILIMLFWFPSNFVPVVISLLMTLPIMISSVKVGIKNTSAEQIFFAKSRGFNRVKILIKIKLPAARINILEGLIQCFSLSWKVVIAGEVLCLPRIAIGQIIHMSQIHLETATVMATTIILVACSYIMEILMKKLLKSFELKIQNN